MSSAPTSVVLLRRRARMTTRTLGTVSSEDREQKTARRHSTQTSEKPCGRLDCSMRSSVHGLGGPDFLGTNFFCMLEGWPLGPPLGLLAGFLSLLSVWHRVFLGYFCGCWVFLKCFHILGTWLFDWYFATSLVSCLLKGELSTLRSPLWVPLAAV